MEQGHAELWPPRDGRGVTPRFLTDVVVCEEYVVQEGGSSPLSGVGFFSDVFITVKRFGKRAILLLG
jgi:hypothetical protein